MTRNERFPHFDPSKLQLLICRRTTQDPVTGQWLGVWDDYTARVVQLEITDSRELQDGVYLQNRAPVLTVQSHNPELVRLSTNEDGVVVWYDGALLFTGGLRGVESSEHPDLTHPGSTITDVTITATGGSFELDANTVITGRTPGYERDVASQLLYRVPGATSVHVHPNIDIDAIVTGDGQQTACPQINETTLTVQEQLERIGRQLSCYVYRQPTDHQNIHIDPYNAGPVVHLYETAYPSWRNVTYTHGLGVATECVCRPILDNESAPPMWVRVTTDAEPTCDAREISIDVPWDLPQLTAAAYRLLPALQTQIIRYATTVEAPFHPNMSVGRYPAALGLNRANGTMERYAVLETRYSINASERAWDITYTCLPYRILDRAYGPMWVSDAPPSNPPSASDVWPPDSNGHTPGVD